MIVRRLLDRVNGVLICSLANVMVQ